MYLLPPQDNYNEIWKVYSTYMESCSVCRHHFHLETGQVPKVGLPISLLPMPHITRRSLDMRPPICLCSK